MKTNSIANDIRYKLDPVAWCREVLGWEPDGWQARFLRTEKRQLLLNCARQTGKSSIVAARVAHRMRYRANYFVLCVAQSDRIALELFNKKIKPALELSGDLQDASKENLHEIVLANGSRCVCVPSNEDTIRGFSALNEVIEDEAAMVDDGVYAAIRPMLMTTKGTICLMSTPKGQRGHFYEAWHGGGDWEKFTIQASSCPRADLEFLKAERAELGEWLYRQEYECEFLSTLDAVFPIEQVKKALDEEMEAFTW